MKDVIAAIAKEKGKVAEAAEKKAQSLEKSRLVVGRNLAEVEDKLGAIKLKMAEAASLNLAQANEIADLKVALEAYETKWYNEGFADAENFVEPIVHLAQSHGFGEGWLVALQAMGVTEDSPLRNLEQIPCPTPPSPVQSQADAADEKDTPSMRELVRAIDSHVDLEATSNLNIAEDAQVQQPPTKDVPGQQANEATHLSFIDPSV